MMCADSLILQEVRRCFERHLSAALIESTGLVRDLKEIDPDKVVEELNKYFDPYCKESCVQDLLGDSLFDFHRDLNSPMRPTKTERDRPAERFVRLMDAAEFRRTGARLVSDTGYCGLAGAP